MSARALPRHWQPLQRAHGIHPRKPGAIKYAAERWGVDEAEALRRIEEDEARCEYWINDLYQVEVRRGSDIDHLNIRRRDGNASFRDWRHFQEIKNQLVGPECEGMELYPAESRLVDTSNKYHLWVVKDPTFRFGVGFRERDVDYDTGKATHAPGMKQREL